MDPGVAALIGAVVGIAGSGLIQWHLQRVRFQQEKESDARTRLGVCRALRAELNETKLVIGQARKRDEVSTQSLRFPTMVWKQHGYRVASELESDDYEVLLVVFGRLGRLDDLLAGYKEPGLLRLVGAGAELDLTGLWTEMGAALVVLERLESRLLAEGSSP